MFGMNIGYKRMKKQTNIIFYFLFFLILNNYIYANQIYLKEHTSIKSNPVKLKDIATIIGSKRDKFKEIVLLTECRSGKIIHNQQIKKTLNQNGFYNFEIIGDSSHCLPAYKKTLKPVVKNVKKEPKLNKILMDKVKQKLGLRQGEITIKILNEKDLALTSEQINMGLTDIKLITSKPFTNLQKAYITVFIQDEYEKKIIKNHFLYFKIGFNSEAYVATRYLPKNMTVNQSDFIRKPIDLSVFSSDIILINELPQNCILKKDIKPGTFLYFSHIKQLPDIKKNTKLKVYFKLNNIELTTWATAISDGYLGEHIQVQITSTKKKKTALLFKEKQGNIAGEIM